MLLASQARSVSVEDLPTQTRASFSTGCRSLPIASRQAGHFGVLKRLLEAPAPRNPGCPDRGASRAERSGAVKHSTRPRPRWRRKAWMVRRPRRKELKLRGTDFIPGDCVDAGCTQRARGGSPLSLPLWALRSAEICSGPATPRCPACQTGGPCKRRPYTAGSPGGG